VRQLIDGAANVPSLSQEVEQAQLKSRIGGTANALFYYLFISTLINAAATALGRRLVRDEADVLQYEGVPGEVILEMASFKPSASITVRLDKPAGLAQKGGEGSVPAGKEERLLDSGDKVRKQSGHPDQHTRRDQNNGSLIERSGVAVREVVRMADGALTGGRSASGNELPPGGMLAAAAVAPDGVSPARRVSMVPLVYFSDLIFGRSEWVLRCRVEEDGTMRWKSKNGGFTSEWVSHTVTQGGPPR